MLAESSGPHCLGAMIRCGASSWHTPVVVMQDEEAAESAAKGAKQARKKAQKSRKSANKAAKAAAPSFADNAAAQLVGQHAASGSRSPACAQPTSGSNATADAAAQPPAGSVTDNSWQLCPLTKVGQTQLSHKPS
jgi:hypothetical protein